MSSQRWARCNFDGRPLHPGDARIARDFALWLEARKVNRDLQWRELVQHPEGSYYRDWYCPMPPLRRAWRIAPGGDEWIGPGPDGLWTQSIREIELAPADLASGPACTCYLGHQDHSEDCCCTTSIMECVVHAGTETARIERAAVTRHDAEQGS
jgi:hypothetical protein